MMNYWKSYGNIRRELFFKKSSLVVHRNAKQREIIEHAQKQDTRPQRQNKTEISWTLNRVLGKSLNPSNFSWYPQHIWHAILVWGSSTSIVTWSHSI
jgi:hypothetical protein